jgi:hypothetical protein
MVDYIPDYVSTNSLVGCPVSKDSVIEELLSVKEYNVERLETKTIEQLLAIRDGKSIKHKLLTRSKYETKLFGLDHERFSKPVLKGYSYNKIKELYNDCILHKQVRLDYIDTIYKKTGMSMERLSKWSTKRLRIKSETLIKNEKTKVIMEKLKNYGDGITQESTPLNIQRQRLNFLTVKGSTDEGDKRYLITKKTSFILRKTDIKPSYKKLMTQSLDILKTELSVLQKEYHMSRLIDYLLKHDYMLSFLKKQKLYVLEYLKSDLQPCKKGSRTELIRILAAKNIWSRNTLRNWNIEKLKNTYIKIIQDVYGPLSETIPDKKISDDETIIEHPRLHRSREEVLRDLSHSIYFDIVS